MEENIGCKTESRPYSERISYRLTSMGTRKNVPIQQKVKFLNLFLEKKNSWNSSRFSLLNTLSAANLGRGFSVLTLLLNKLHIAFISNSLDKLAQLISMRPHIDDLKYLIKYYYSHFKDLRFKKKFLLFVMLFFSMFLNDKILLPEPFMVFSLFFSTQNPQFLTLVSLNNSLNSPKIPKGFLL